MDVLEKHESTLAAFIEITLCVILTFEMLTVSAQQLSVGIQSAGDLVSETLGSNPAFSVGRQLVFLRLENRLHMP